MKKSMGKAKEARKRSKARTRRKASRTVSKREAPWSRNVPKTRRTPKTVKTRTGPKARKAKATSNGPNAQRKRKLIKAHKARATRKTQVRKAHGAFKPTDRSSVVTGTEIQRIAQLAELSVDDATAAQLEVQLSRILGYVAQLSELPKDGDVDWDVGSVRLRADELGYSDQLLRPPEKWAAAFKRDLFVVPRLGELDKGDDAP